MILVGDIGGTNARFALVSSSSKDSGYCATDIQVFPTDQYPSIYDAMSVYVSKFSNYRITQACLAIATSVKSEEINMTNNGWGFSLNEFKQRFNFEKFKLINDFTALALSLPGLSSDQLFKVCGEKKVADTALAVLGAGTGLGVSALIPSPSGWIPIEGEGGHCSIGAMTQGELEIFQRQYEQFGHMSAERLLSGSGIYHIYQTMCDIENKPAVLQSAAQVTNNAISGDCEICQRVMDLFFGWLGIFAGNVALTFGAQGGVYLGGGILPRLLTQLQQSSFIRHFGEKGRFSNYLKSIPVYVITEEYPAFSGAARALEEIYDHIGVSYSAS